jgi:hypothetical protein
MRSKADVRRLLRIYGFTPWFILVAQIELVYENRRILVSVGIIDRVIHPRRTQALR